MADPIFIVIEGIDGSGTSTQTKAVAAALSAGGSDAIATAEPTQGAIGRMIREILAGRMAPPLDNEAQRRLLAYLYAADRQDHLDNMQNGIRPALRSGRHVVCCRYVLSSLAYEGGDTDEMDFVRRLNADFPVPDLTIYLDCPVEVSIARLRTTRPALDIFENEPELKRIRANYERLLDDYAGRVLRLPATDDPASLTRRIIDEIGC